MPEPSAFLNPKSFITPEMKKSPTTSRRGRRATPQPKVKAQITSVKKKVTTKSGRQPMSRERKIKLFRASIASPKTPERLKIALKKKLKEMGA